MTGSASPPTLPTPPAGTPPVLVHLVALVLVIVGPVLAFTDPSGKISTGAAQAAVIIVFVAIAGLIFLTRIIIEGVHQHGWNMKTLDWVWSQSQQVLDQDIQEFKQLWPQAKPAVTAMPGMQGTLESLTATVNDIRARATAATSPADNAAIVAAVKDLVVPLALKENSGAPPPPAASAIPATAQVPPPPAV